MQLALLVHSPLHLLGGAGGTSGVVEGVEVAIGVEVGVEVMTGVAVGVKVGVGVEVGTVVVVGVGEETISVGVGTTSVGVGTISGVGVGEGKTWLPESLQWMVPTTDQVNWPDEGTVT